MDLAGEIEAAGVTLVPIHKRHRWDGTILTRLVAFLRAQRIDILHTWIFTANSWGRLAGLIARTPVIIGTERNVDIWKHGVHRLVDRTLAQFSDVMLANSQEVKRFMVDREGISPSKCRVIYNGVDSRIFAPVPPTCQPQLRRELGLPENCVIVGTVANFRPQKDYATLLSAIARVHQARPDVHFVACGSGTGQADVAAAAGAAGLSGTLSILGPRRDIPRVLSAIDVFVLASQFEGFSNAVLEAMATSLPVVATDVGGNAEAVVDGTTGIIVPAREPEALAHALLAMIDDPVLRRQAGAAGRERVVGAFAPFQVIQAYECLYSELARSKQRGLHGLGV